MTLILSPQRPPRLCGKNSLSLLPLSPLILSNSAQIAAGETITAANAFHVLQRDRLSIPYGDFPHSVGLQRLTRAAAESMVAKFHSLRGAVTREFGGLPFYTGHPDDPSFSNSTSDASAKGWIMDLDAGPDAMGLSIKWNDHGDDIIRNARYKYFSPRWAVREIGRENNRPVVEPYWLISCGFTNDPNIPVAPLSNTRDNKTKGDSEMKWLIDMLKLAPEATQEQTQAAVQAAISNAAKKKSAEEKAAQAEAATKAAEARAVKSEADLAAAKTALDEQKVKSEADLKAANDRLSAERDSRIGLVVSNAILEGKISKAQEAVTIENLKKDFDGQTALLAKAANVHRNSSVVARLPGGVPADSKGASILIAVNERMASTKLDFHTCYMQIKKEQPKLFAN